MKNGREEKYNQKYGLAYGNDHIVGLFIQVWKINKKYSPRAFENQPDSDNILIDYDQFAGSLNPDNKEAVKSIVNLAGKYGFDLSYEIPEEEIQIEV